VVVVLLRPHWRPGDVQRGRAAHRAGLTVLDDDAVHDAARRLLAAERSREPIRQLTLQYPDMTIEDAYRVQRALVAVKLTGGRTVKARKIGLTSRAMQQAVLITEALAGAGDVIHADFGDLGAVTCRFR
jgi:2-keto-4-pentenoate hydratase